MRPSSSWRVSSLSKLVQSLRVGVAGTFTSTRRSTTRTAEMPKAAARDCSQARWRQLAEHQVGMRPRALGCIGWPHHPQAVAARRRPTGSVRAGGDSSEASLSVPRSAEAVRPLSARSGAPRRLPGCFATCAVYSSRRNTEPTVHEVCGPAILIATHDDENLSGSGDAVLTLVRGEPIEVSGAGSSGSFDWCCELVGLYPWQRTLRTSIGREGEGAQLQMSPSPTSASLMGRR